MTTPRVALQLYTVRENLKADFAGTLRDVAKIGYPAVQMAGYGDMTAADLKRLLDDLGLAVAGSHIGLSRLETSLDEEIDFNLAIGNRDIIVPALPQDRRGTRADYVAFARQFTELAERCRARGARFHYHNHAFEFTRFDGEYALDILMGQTPADLVLFEPDVYWIAVGGEDPAALIRRFAGRIPYIHVKDLAPDRTPSWAEVGAGNLDFPAIFAASESGGAEWYVVEQDSCPGPALESARISLENLRAWGKL